jgi:hypothetical protein
MYTTVTYFFFVFYGYENFISYITERKMGGIKTVMRMFQHRRG